MSLARLLTAKEVSEILQIDIQRVYELTRRNQLPCVRLGERQYRYSREQLENFVQHGGNQLTEEMENEN